MSQNNFFKILKGKIFQIFFLGSKEILSKEDLSTYLDEVEAAGGGRTLSKSEKYFILNNNTKTEVLS